MRSSEQASEQTNERVGRSTVPRRRKSRGVIEADRERVQKEREIEKKGERGRAGERESRAHLLRPDIDLAAASLSSRRLRPSNTFRRNRDFSQLWTRAGERERDVDGLRARVCCMCAGRGTAIHHAANDVHISAGFSLSLSALCDLS